MYTTPEKVRIKILGVDSTVAPDEVLIPLIEDATRIVIRRLTVRVRKEIPEKGQDPREFYLKHQFIADTNGDMIIDQDDIKVYSWEDLWLEETKREEEVELLEPLTGRIWLAKDPGNRIITVDYSYYVYSVDWDLVDLATAYYAAKMWVERELLLVPPTVRIGRITTKHREYWQTLNSEFERIMHLLNSCPMDVVHYSKIIVHPRGDWQEKIPQE